MRACSDGEMTRAVVGAGSVVLPFLVAALAGAVVGCGGGDSEGGDTGAGGGSSVIDGGGDAKGDAAADASDAETEGGDAGTPDADAGADAVDDVSSDGDASDDGAADAGSVLCACDTTDLCDQGCSCDIACSITPGKPPLGGDAMLFDRAEVAVYFPSAPGGSIDRATLFDDGYTGQGGPTPPFEQLLAPTARSAIAVRPVAFSSDLDGDGRDEPVLVGTSGVVVDDWDGTALASRTVYTYPTTGWFDGAAGDLDGDGGRELVVSHQYGDMLTIDVLSVGTTGTATLRASTTLTGVARHAITVGRAKAGDPAEVFALVAGTGLPGTLESLKVHAFTLAGATLTEGTLVDLKGLCLVPSAQTPIDDGMAIAVGNLDADPESEIAYAVYCGGELNVAAHDPGLPYERAWINPPSFDPDTIDRGAFRPLLAIGRLGPNALSAQRIAVGTTRAASGSNNRGPIGSVTVLAINPNISGLYVEAGSDIGPYNQHSVLTGLAVRDVDRDGRDEIVTASTNVDAVQQGLPGPCTTSSLSCSVNETGVAVRVYEHDFGGAPVELFDSTGQSGPNGVVGPGVVVAAGDLDADGVRVRSTGNVYLHTGRPFVNAVLAAPPTWIGVPGVVQADGSGTSFGITNTSSTADSHNISASASVTVSAGANFGIVEASASISASVEFSQSSTFEQSISYGKETSVGPDADLVLFRAIPYASYEYEVVSHPDPAEIGQMITIDVPGTMIDTVRTLADFRAEYGTEADAAIPPGLLGHTIGDPSTYPDTSGCTQPAIAARVGTGIVSAVYASPTLVDVGKASSGTNTQTIGMGQQTSSSTDVNLSVEMSVGVGAGGVSIETSAGIGVGWSHETTVGKDVSYSGTVGFLSQGYDQNTRYTWGLCVFHFADAAQPKYGAYPVVDYVVHEY